MRLQKNQRTAASGQAVRSPEQRQGQVTKNRSRPLLPAQEPEPRITKIEEHKHQSHCKYINHFLLRSGLQKPTVVPTNKHFKSPTNQSQDNQQPYRVE